MKIIPILSPSPAAQHTTTMATNNTNHVFGEMLIKRKVLFKYSSTSKLALIGNCVVCRKIGEYNNTCQCCNNARILVRRINGHGIYYLLHPLFVALFFQMRNQNNPTEPYRLTPSNLKVPGDLVIQQVGSFARKKHED